MLGFFVVEAWGCQLAVEPGLLRHRSAAAGEGSRAEQSWAEQSSPPGQGNGEAAGLGLRLGRGGLWAQEVELEAEAEAVVVLGPRSVLLPSIDREERRCSETWNLLSHSDPTVLPPWSHALCACFAYSQRGIHAEQWGQRQHWTCCLTVIPGNTRKRDPSLTGNRWGMNV